MDFLAFAFLLVSAEESLIAAQKRLTESNVSLTINTHSAGNTGKRANSHLLVSNDGCLLFDAQLAERDTNKLIELIQSIGKPLQAVFVTSPRPEHTSGLAALKAAFPKAEVVAPKSFAKRIDAKPWGEPTYAFAGEKLAILPLQRGKGDDAVAIYVPVLSVLVAGDLVWGNVPLPDDELGRDRKAWKKRLASIGKERKITTVLSGFGEIGPTTLLDDMKKTLDAGK